MTRRTSATSWACRRSGFTLVETLVVVAVVGLLPMLTFSAVQAAREASRRASCSANLRQLGIALSSYSAAVGSLPHSVNAQRGYSVHSMILPYLDARVIFNSINFSLETHDRENRTARSAVVGTFLCPSDDASGRPYSNYVITMGYGHQLRRAELNGVFARPPAPPTSLADVPDGTSNTVMMSESVIGLGGKTPYKPLGSVFRTPQKLDAAGEFDQFLAVCRGMGPAEGHRYGGKGTSWIQSGYSFTYYNHNLLPQEKSCSNGGLTFEGAWTASAFHPSGVNVLFADGRVRFVGGTVALPVWRAVATRAGGETVDRLD
ncbi:MAG: DUF1559 domain-containing protein [Isosphaeraceae bacterium]